MKMMTVSTFPSSYHEINYMMIGIIFAAVCGSDRNTYKSFCHLIQMAPPNTRVAHAGRCDRQECTGGEVMIY